MASHSHDSHSHDSHSQDFTAANRTFFNDLAAKYDIKPWQQKLTLQVTNYIHQNLSFIAIPTQRPTKLLDYACGTGMISRALAPSVDTIYALDLSPKMIERYNELAKDSDIPSVRGAHTLECNLLADADIPSELNGAEWRDFDIAAVGLGVHHFSDPGKAIERLAQRLKIGGVLLIVDFLDEEQIWVPSDADRTIHKHGFSEGEIRELMEKQGLGGFGWKLMPETVEIRMHEDNPIYRKLFLARAARFSPV